MQIRFKCPSCGYFSAQRHKRCPMCGYASKGSLKDNYLKAVKAIMKMRSAILYISAFLIIAITLQHILTIGNETVEVPAKVFYAMLVTVYVALILIIEQK